MPTKKPHKQNLKKDILRLQLEGMSREDIKLKFKSKNSTKQIDKLLEESPFLSPKSFKLGSLFMFVIALLTTPVSIYLRGAEYEELRELSLLIGVLFSLPFIVLHSSLTRTKNLDSLYTLSLFFLAYLIFYISFLLALSYLVGIWTMFILPSILLPTFVVEILKFNRLRTAISSK